jgi:hypothetical protein
MPSVATYEQVYACNGEDVCACFHAKYNPGTATAMAAMAIDPYEWFWWRFDPFYRWHLRNLLWPTQNNGPYSVPVLCALAAADANTSQGQNESDLDFLRRCYCILNNLTGGA